MLKKIWSILLPIIIVASFALAVINLVTTRSNNLMLKEIINTK